MTNTATFSMDSLRSVILSYADKDGQFILDCRRENDEPPLVIRIDDVEHIVLAYAKSEFNRGYLEATCKLMPKKKK